MADGGQHFAGKDVDQYCIDNGITHITTPAYAPWVNGLVEGANKILIGRLKRLCAPDLDERGSAAIDPESIPNKWPDFLEKAIAQMNDRILPAVGYSPREMMMGMTTKQETEHRPAEKETSGGDQVQTRVHMAMVNAFNEEVTERWVQHAEKRKRRFDEKVKEISFERGDLVQVENSKLQSTMETKRKILPRWSGPVRVTERQVNSYRVETLQGQPLKGRVHARRLKRFTPRRGTVLDEKRDEEGIRALGVV